MSNTNYFIITYSDKTSWNLSIYLDKFVIKNDNEPQIWSLQMLTPWLWLGSV